MPLIAKDPGGGSNFILAPEDLHLAVCCDVYPLGLITSEWNGKKKTQAKILVAWQTERLIPHEVADANGTPEAGGKPYLLMKRYTLSLHERASLRQDLQRWRGRPFTASELEGFDVEVLVCAPCQLQVIHNRRDERTYANVDGILKAPPGTTLDVRDYTRKKDRPDWVEPVMVPDERLQSMAERLEDEDDSDIPF